MSKRKQPAPDFKAKVVLEALKGEETVSRGYIHSLHAGLA